MAHTSTRSIMLHLRRIRKSSRALGSHRRMSPFFFLWTAWIIDTFRADQLTLFTTLTFCSGPLAVGRSSARQRSISRSTASASPPWMALHRYQGQILALSPQSPRALSSGITLAFIPFLVLHSDLACMALEKVKAHIHSHRPPEIQYTLRSDLSLPNFNSHSRGDCLQRHACTCH